MKKSKRYENGSESSCGTCLRYLPQKYHIGIQKLCMRTKSEINPKRHHGCAFHPDCCPLSEDETQEREKILKEIKNREEFIERMQTRRCEEDSSPPKTAGGRSLFAAMQALAATIGEKV